jgi:phosphatidylglycerophosphate synthase
VTEALVPAFRTGPIVGLIGQVALLAALAATAGLGPAGWLVGAAYGIFTGAALTWGLHRSGARALGPANRVTLTRAILVGGITALAADSLGRDIPVRVLITLAIAALMLDAVDGKVARRTGSCSPLGARFDMEVDAFLILVFSVYLARPYGVWVLAIGVMRYAFLVAGWVLPWLRAKLPARYWRKVVAATQGIVLMVATAGVLPWSVMAVALAAALVLLVESFGNDIGWLWRQRRPAVVVGLPAPRARESELPAARVRESELVRV